MAARDSMNYIIGQVRLMIGDAESANSHFRDDQIQGALDDHRKDVEAEPLSARLNDTQFVAQDGWWEKVAVLTGAGGTLTPANSDWRGGRWTFGAAQPEGVTLTGSTFDVYGAAAELLDLWATALALEVEQFTADGLTVRRSGRANLQALATQYRAKSKGYGAASGVQFAQLVRLDVNPMG